MNIEQQIKNKALELGFLDCGFATARRLTEFESQFSNWLEHGYHGEMGYMENHFDKRLDPTQLVPDAKTVISLAYNYFPSKKQEKNVPQIAKYAYGEDYHKVVKDQCFLLLQFIQQLLPNTQGRCFVDSAPVLERQWAQVAGLGWLGKNSLLLKKSVGSYFFLSEIIINQEIESSQPFETDHCGECTRCIDACPTEAIVANGLVDATKCLSYVSIEKRSELTSPEKKWLETYLFGCDVCQDVCPWNRFATPTHEKRFSPNTAVYSENWLDWDRNRWKSVSEDEFNQLFGKTPVTRMGFEKLKSVLGTE